MEQKHSSGSGQRSHKRLLGIKNSAIRRAEAETGALMKIRCGMVDCYVEKIDVTCWHPKGVQKSERTVRLHMTTQKNSQFCVTWKEICLQLELYTSL